MKRNPFHRKDKVHVFPVTLQIFVLVFLILMAGGVFAWRQNRKFFYEEQMETAWSVLWQAAVLEASQMDLEKFLSEPVDLEYFKGRIKEKHHENWLDLEGVTRREEEEEYRTKLYYGYYSTGTQGAVLLAEMEEGTREDLAWANQAMERREAVRSMYEHREKQYLAFYMPVLSESGQAVGTIKCSLETEKLKNRARQTAQSLSNQIFFGFFLITMVIMGMIAFFLRPLRQLKDFLREVGEGGNVKNLQCRGNTEISQLIEILSRMWENIQEYRKKVKWIENRYQPFVPKELVALLGKEDIRQVKAGDGVDCEGTLAVIQMEPFFGCSPDNQAEEMFEKIQQGMCVILPGIHKSQGLIVRFFPGGVLALFPKQGEQAAACMEQILEELKEKTKIPCSAAMDYRRIRLELAGDDSRMQFTVREEDLKELNRLVWFSGKYSLGMVAGRGFYEKLKEEGQERFVRCLGSFCREAGQEEPVIYQLPNQRQEIGFARLKETKEDFSLGIQAFEMGRFREGRERFTRILRRNPDDRAAQQYFIWCDEEL